MKIKIENEPKNLHAFGITISDNLSFSIHLGLRKYLAFYRTK